MGKTVTGILVPVVTVALQAAAAFAAGGARPADRVRERIDAGRYAEAATLARQLLDAEQRRGPESVAAAQAMSLLAETLELAGKPLEAQGFSDRGVAILERTLAPDHPDLAQALSVAGWLRIHEDLAGARAMLERALAIQQRTPGTEALETARTVVRLGQLAGLCWERREEQRRLTQALPVLERVLGPLHPETLWVRGSLADPQRPAICIATLQAVLEDFARAGLAGHPLAAALRTGLGTCRGAAGDFAGSHREFEEVLALQQAALGAEHPDVAYTLFALGVLHGNLGETAVARSYMDRSLALAQKSYGADSHRLGTMLGAYAWLVEAQTAGGLDHAYELLRRAVELESAGYGSCPGVASELLHLAVMARDRGEYGEAKTTLERALGMLEAHEESSSDTLAEALHYLGEVEGAMGDLDRARAHLERSLAMAEQLRGRDHFSLWVVLADLGDVLAKLGDQAGAAAHLLRSIELLERNLAPDFGGIAIDLSLLARVRTEQRDFASARQLLERALRIADKAFGPEGGRTELVLRSLCGLQIATGDLEAAGLTCARAVRTAAVRYGEDHPSYAWALARQSTVELARGARAAALEDALEAEARARAHFLRTTEELSSREALSLEGVRQSGLDVALSIVAASVADGAAAARDTWRTWDEVVRSRAMVLDEMASRPRTTLTADAETRELSGKLDAARARLSRLSLRSIDSGASASLVDRAIDDLDVAERALAARQATVQRKDRRARLGLADVARALPPRAALVAYVRYERLSSAAPIVWTPSYLAFVRAPRASETFVADLGPAARIEGLIAAWKRELAPVAPGEADPDGEARYRRAAAALREAVWDPIRPHVAGAELAIVVPDGDLHLVNFADLPAPDGRYLIEKLPVLHLVSAERDVAALATPRTDRGRGLLIVGGADFDLAPAALVSENAGDADVPVYRGPASSCASLREQTFRPLPRSLAEVELVQELWRKGAADPRDASVIELVGARATEGAFKRLAAGPRVVHLATHGFFSGPECRDGGAPGGRRSGELLTLAGLAFAGANRRAEAAAEQEDGILTAEEVASLDLGRADWVVLSACDSGIGKVVDGEGVLGLRRSFQTAGARTLILSLWPVQDEPARHWMSRLYEARARGEPTASAVRSAGLEVLRERRGLGLTTHPRSWGAFVAVGDWR